MSRDTIRDYIGWRKDITMAERPLNEIDGIVFCYLSYLNLTEVWKDRPRTFRQLFDEYFFSMLGSRLGRLEVSVPQVVGVGFFFMYLRAVNMPEEGELFLGPVKKTLTVILCLGCIAGITLAMALSDTPLSSSLVLGIQGRYFLPLLPVLAVVLRSRSVTVGCNLKPRLVFWTVLLNVWTLLYAFGHAIFR